MYINVFGGSALLHLLLGYPRLIVVLGLAGTVAATSTLMVQAASSARVSISRRWITSSGSGPPTPTRSKSPRASR